MGAEVKELATDILVIGSECAGACIPLAADAGDRKITIVTKGLQEGSGATQLGGYSGQRRRGSSGRAGYAGTPL